MAKGKYTTADLRQLIAASRSGSGTWPIEVANKLGRTYGAVLTMIGRVQESGSSLDKIEEALNQGVVPELHGSLQEYLSKVRDATTPRVSLSTENAPNDSAFHSGVMQAFAEALTKIANNVQCVLDSVLDIESRLDAIDARLTDRLDTVTIDSQFVSSAMTMGEAEAAGLIKIVRPSTEDLDARADVTNFDRPHNPSDLRGLTLPIQNET